jgi:hypothetical protein
MDSTKTRTAVPEQNSKLNIYVYTVYCNHTAISIKVVTDNSQMYNNMSAMNNGNNDIMKYITNTNLICILMRLLMC